MKITIFAALLFSSIFSHAEEILLSREGGVYHIPATLNDTLHLNFVVDTGASMVYLPNYVFEKLKASGTVTRSDIIGRGKSRIANGNIVDILIVNLKKIKIGQREVRNVRAGIGSDRSTLLLGQSLLKRLEPWHIDTKRGLLKFASKKTVRKSYVSPSKNIGRSEALLFVDRYLSLLNTRNFSQTVSLYANRVDYRDEGVVGKAVLADHIEHFFREWQNININLTRFIEAKPIKAKKGETVVRYKTFYKLKNTFEQSGRSGQSLTTLVLKKKNGMIRIISEKVKTISENRY